MKTVVSIICIALVSLGTMFNRSAAKIKQAEKMNVISEEKLCEFTEVLDTLKISVNKLEATVRDK